MVDPEVSLRAVLQVDEQPRHGAGLIAQGAHERPEVHPESHGPDQRPNTAQQCAHFIQAGILAELPQGIPEEEQDRNRDQNFVGRGHRHNTPPEPSRASFKPAAVGVWKPTAEQGLDRDIACGCCRPPW